MSGASMRCGCARTPRECTSNHAGQRLDTGQPLRRRNCTVGRSICAACARRRGLASARALAAPALRWSDGELLRMTMPVLERLPPSYGYFHDLGRGRRLFRPGARLRVLELAGLALVGTPEDCLQRMHHFHDAGVTHLLCFIGAGALPSEVVRESLECIAREVLPRLP